MSSIAKILIIDDKPKFLADALPLYGYDVEVATDGMQGIKKLTNAKTGFDLVLLDVMMPGLDGFEVLSRYRAEGGKAPVLFLTARDAVSDRVRGLDTGADDYLVKPFSFQELLARIRVLLRRGGGNNVSAVLRVQDLVLDPASHSVSRAGRSIDLSAKEYAILECLMRNKGMVLSRESIREHIWSWDYDGESNVVDVYIRYLRRKIDDDYSVKLIQTVRGSGYMIKE